MNVTATESRGWGWAAHLRAGGTTPWAAWRGEAPAEPVMAGALPGAEQLELLRRLNLTGPVPQALAERVLTTTAPGRGRRGLPLAGDGPPPAYGVAPVDPAGLGSAELLRGASLLLAQDLVAGAVDPEPRSRWRRRLRARYRIAGDGWLTGPLRDELGRRGRPEGGRGMTVYVVGAPVDEMLCDVWTARCFGQGVVAFDTWLDRVVRRGGLPARADLVRIARWWVERIGRERVRVVLDPNRLPELLGTRGPLPGRPRISADAAEVARQVGPALALLVGPEERARLLRRGLLPRLRRVSPPTPASPALAVPGRHRDWVATQARAQRDALVADGYDFCGDPDLLLPRQAAAPAATGPAPDTERALALTLRLLVDGPRRNA
ncbi:hypothetical protein [Nocardioides sp. KR10-350]|uniref:hypothetical protein n=1 Tax=Nocardioides cheoyonin TaxID=3156615 RepID=UPI0032B6209E